MPCGPAYARSTRPNDLSIPRELINCARIAHRAAAMTVRIPSRYLVFMALSLEGQGRISSGVAGEPPYIPRGVAGHWIGTAFAHPPSSLLVQQAELSLAAI